FLDLRRSILGPCRENLLFVHSILDLKVDRHEVRGAFGRASTVFALPRGALSDHKFRSKNIRKPLNQFGRLLAVFDAWCKFEPIVSQQAASSSSHVAYD